MSLPFTTEQFLDVFVRYNEAVWPAPLALFWLWSGVVYHAVFFSGVNPVSGIFAGVFVAGAAVFAWHGIVHDRLRFGLLSGARGSAGFALLSYALVAYPLLSMSLGHGYPAMPTFGAPCPVTIFTLGMLAFLRPPYPRQVFVAPFVWVLVASQATLFFRMYEDLGLLVAGAAGVWFALQPFPEGRAA